MGLQQHTRCSSTFLAQYRPEFMAITLLFLVTLFDIGHPTPAMAIPMSGDYRIDYPAVLVGTFTSDGTKMTAWDFISTDQGTGLGPIVWSSADMSGVEHNGPSFFQVNGLSSLQITFSPYGNADQALGGMDIFVTVPCPVVEQCGGPTSTRGNIHIPWIPVPEATTTLLLALGVISLAGFQWWQHRQGQIQMN